MVWPVLENLLIHRGSPNRHTNLKRDEHTQKAQSSQRTSAAKSNAVSMKALLRGAEPLVDAQKRLVMRSAVIWWSPRCTPDIQRELLSKQHTGG